MKFTRTLSLSCIETLNSAYDSEHWWRRMVDDKDAFILIRNNMLHVQANGGLLMQISPNGKKQCVCRMHEDFLTLRSETDPYVTLEQATSNPIKRVEGLKGFATHYEKIKRRIRIFTGKEKQAVQYLASNIQEFVDIEIGFEGDLKEDCKRKGAPRIDMAAITNEGVLMFYEVKLSSNSEIISQRTPKVVDQLKKYEQFLAANKDEIIKSYMSQLDLYRQLEGEFFKRRERKIKKLSLHPHVRLIITGFNEAYKNLVLPHVRKKIEVGMGWSEGSNELIAIGNHKGLVKSNRLFLGI